MCMTDQGWSRLHVQGLIENTLGSCKDVHGWPRLVKAVRAWSESMLKYKLVCTAGAPHLTLLQDAAQCVLMSRASSELLASHHPSSARGQQSSIVSYSSVSPLLDDGVAAAASEQSSPPSASHAALPLDVPAYCAFPCSPWTPLSPPAPAASPLPAPTSTASALQPTRRGLSTITVAAATTVSHWVAVTRMRAMVECCK